MPDRAFACQGTQPCRDGVIAVGFGHVVDEVGVGEHYLRWRVGVRTCDQLPVRDLGRRALAVTSPRPWRLR